ncbi:MAG: DNA topoisomerase I [Candidatus Bathyarchaeota archaeon]|nr:DNA topoisomerase I [Candidatus Bathyarchaeota archaeon]MDH5623622.1 DNA topoisomerase I [Candidatus Bathyarchaeota archaeon]MDH5636233.1 DNA topoisomerase I [Candidatus Bathyarchaeota archaeon]
MGKYTLIITEKPDAAQRIAQALDGKGKPKKVEENGVPYFIAHRDRELVVVPALGHLYTVIHERGRRNYYPVFNFKWAPRHLAERGAKQIRTWIETISKLAKDAEDFIAACDYDLEGSLIGYCILKYACENKEGVAKRMKFSTLMKSELERAYEEPLPQLNFALIEAGRTRHEVDWLYGVNLSRALTLAARRWSGRYSTLSTGRVQGPTLRFLIGREKEIRSFVPTPYWEIKAEVEIKKSTCEVEYERKRIEKKAEADAVVRACTDKIGEIKEVGVRKFHQKPPIPFDIGTLQTEAYSLFGYTPRRTLGIAQRLYLDALISYPRTSSQKLPPIIDYKKILNALSKEPAYKKLASKLLEKEELKPREGAKEDPAHPAVYPTGNLPERTLSDPEKKVWDLVVKRFMAVFGETAIKQSVKIRLEVNSHNFFLRGRRILKEGWMQFYKPYARAEETLLPPIKEGETILLKRVMRDDKFTNPPPRYNPSSLLKKMEGLGIGTKATRADIIETLYNRGYVTDERMVVTDLGFDIVDILSKCAPRVISVKLTQELEKKMERIQSKSEKRENILLEAVEQLKPQLEQFKEKEGPIGEALSNAIKRARMQERIVGGCPTCGTGTLMILFSRRTRKRFIGCTNYFKGICKTSFPLPQRGTAKPMGKTCSSCGWPLVRVQIRGRRPWRLCFNPNCPLKEERRKRNEMQNLQ